MVQYHSLRGSQLGINAASAASYDNDRMQPIASPSQAGVSYEAPLEQAEFTCVVCFVECESHSRLAQHGKQQNHKPYGCPCSNSARFTRVDALKRHIATHSDVSKRRYPCEYCGDRQGENAFYRRDHLLQHYKGPHRDDDRVPGHLRGLPNAVVNSQDIYDLSQHSSEGPPESLQFEPQQPLLECTLPGCDQPHGHIFLSPEELNEHQDMVHPM